VGTSSAPPVKAGTHSAAADLLLPTNAWQLSGMRTTPSQPKLQWATTILTDGGVQMHCVRTSGRPHQIPEALTAPTARNVLGRGLGKSSMPVWQTAALILYLSELRAGMVAKPQM